MMMMMMMMMAPVAVTQAQMMKAVAAAAQKAKEAVARGEVVKAGVKGKAAQGRTGVVMVMVTCHHSPACQTQAHLLARRMGQTVSHSQAVRAGLPRQPAGTSLLPQPVRTHRMARSAGVPAAAHVEAEGAGGEAEAGRTHWLLVRAGRAPSVKGLKVVCRRRSDQVRGWVWLTVAGVLV
jgi:hypothetical protein